MLLLQRGAGGDGPSAGQPGLCLSGTTQLREMKADRNAIDQAYAFFHQKLKVYEHSTSEREMDHIEDCIASYANSMSKELFDELSQSNPAFLHEHTTFLEDLTKAVGVMERWLQ